MFRKLVLPLFALTLLFWIAGCSQSPTDSQTDSPGMTNKDFGGFTATSEAPGFGDPELLDEAAGEVAYDDPMLRVAQVDSIVTDPDAGYFHFRAVWGRLTYDSTVTTVTDWSGSLTASRGALIIRRLIRFEDGQDSLLERTDRKVVEWVSETTTHNDGIAVDLYVPRALPVIDTTETPEVDTLGDTTWVVVIDTLMPERAELTFETGPYSHTFTMDELMELDTVIYLDDSNAVAFTAARLDRLPCASGFIAGHWGRDEDGNGVFRGTWMGRHGRVEGWLRGDYGQNENGDKVFYGKWISKSGLFEGLLRGIWEFHPNWHANERAFRHAGGWFRGTINDANGDRIGVLKGKFKGPDHPIKAGYFDGLWRLDCGSADNDNDWWDESDSPWRDRDNNDGDAGEYHGGDDD